MRNILITLVFLATLLVSCKRTNKDQVVGPESKAASSSFAVLDTLKANYFNGFTIPKKSLIDSIAFQYVQEIKRDSVNVKTGVVIKDYFTDATNYFKRNVFFKVRFNEEVTWNLTLFKLVNGIKDPSFFRSFAGTSSYLDSSNTSWDGKASGKLFAKGDIVLAELSFLSGTNIKLYDTLFVNKGEYYTPDKAQLLIDFEDGTPNTFPYIDDLDAQPSPRPSIDRSIKAPQGNSSFKIYGTDNNGDYFCGGVNIQKFDLSILSTYSPSDIYINLYIYGYPVDNALGISSKATKLNIGISENDVNSSDDFDPLTEDTFEKQIAVDWVGWKLISVRYSDLTRSNSKIAGGNGNGKFEPNKVFSVNCNLISSPNGSTVGANIDYVILTYGQPFEAQ